MLRASLATEAQRSKVSMSRKEFHGVYAFGETVLRRLGSRVFRVGLQGFRV